MLGEVNAQITEGVPADLLKRKQENLDRQQEIAQQLTGISLSGDQKEKPSELESDLDKLQTEFDDIENQIRTASPRYAALTAAQPQSLADVQQKVLDDGTVLLEYSLGRTVRTCLPSLARAFRFSSCHRDQIWTSWPQIFAPS